MSSVSANPAASRDASTRRPRRIGREGYKVNWWLTALLIAGTLTILIPLYFTIAMALKEPAQIVGQTGLEPPDPVRWANFAEAAETVNFGRAILITALITVFSVLGSLVLSSMVAYSVSRNWDHKFFRYGFIYLLSAMFVPFVVVILPLTKQTGLLGLDNPIGVTILHILAGLPFNTLLLIAFLRSIPPSLEESALIDGASIWKIYTSIIVPLLSPMLATIGIFAFLAAWNDFLMPQMIIADPTMQTLPVLQQLFQGEFNQNYPLAFASYLMQMAPTLIVYIVAQRWILAGVLRGAVK
ncbi:carbohydrate ABC transporter permease [Haematomicrobium sanguinis]|uniref:carbohydrate ABC transporter permease n=1 Tax=Haematomicrobium sanguinis TaxID=479106 RepID=UPI00047AB30C|nr:carbohydrate ABC transporter permease [Haematomicrobium sanguinis]